MFELKWICWCLGLIPLLTACGDAADPEWMGTVTDSSGVRIVQNPTEGLWTAGNGWSVTEELRIGAVGGEREYQFGRLVGIDVDEAGNGTLREPLRTAEESGVAPSNARDLAQLESSMRAEFESLRALIGLGERHALVEAIRSDTRHVDWTAWEDVIAAWKRELYSELNPRASSPSRPTMQSSWTSARG